MYFWFRDILEGKTESYALGLRPPLGALPFIWGPSILNPILWYTGGLPPP